MKKNKIKVLQIIDKYSFGGVESIVYALISKFTSENIDIFYYFLRDTGVNKRIIKKNIFIGNSPKLSIYPLCNILKIIKKEGIQIIHSHHRKGFYLVCILSIFLKSKKYVHHEHGDIFLRNPFYVLFMNLFRNNFDKIIAVSNVGKKELLKKTKICEDKIDILNNFIDLEKFASHEESKTTVPREKLSIKKEDFVIGFVGRLSKEKGADILIESLPYLNLNYKVLIVGDGILRKKLERLVDKLCLRENVLFLGYVSQPQTIYPLFDILVVSSRSESFSLTVLEAQAMHVPIIASNIDALNNLLKNHKTAIFFEKGNEKDLADKIELIYKNECLRKKLIDEGLENIKKFTLGNYLKSLEEIYNELRTQV